MSRFTVRKLSDEERGGTSPSGRFAVRKLEQALPGGSRGAVAPLPNLSLQAAKARLQTGSTPISGAAVDRFFPAAAPSLRDEDALRAEVRTRSGSPAPLPTARPSAGLMLPTGAALQQERAEPRKLVTLPATFDVSPAGERDNSTAFDIDPATVGTRAEYVPGPTGLARLGLGLKSIGQGIAGTPGVIYETGKQMLVDTWRWSNMGRDWKRLAAVPRPPNTKPEKAPPAAELASSAREKEALGSLAALSAM